MSGHRQSRKRRESTTCRPPEKVLLATLSVPHWVPHHVDGVEEPLVADGPADRGTAFLQQHQRLEALGRAVGHDPAAVPGAEGETALESSRPTRPSSLLGHDAASSIHILLTYLIHILFQSIFIFVGLKPKMFSCFCILSVILFFLSFTLYRFLLL